jgi:hypothetical protein
MIDAMLDPETRKFLASSRGRRQVELYVRLVAESLPLPPDQPHQLALARQQSWDAVKARVLEAVGRFEERGLRVLRQEPSRHGLIVTASADAWRRFIDGEKSLIADPAITFGLYTRPWSSGLPGFPQ